MFKLSFLKKNNFLGIDFGTSSIKVVELTYKNGNVHLLNYGWVDIPMKTKANELNHKTQGKEDSDITTHLGKLLDKMDVQSDSAHISIGGFKGLAALIKVNKVADDDIAEIIKSEAGKHIPVSLDEVYLSWDIVSKNIPKKNLVLSGKDSVLREGDKESAEVLLVAASKEDVRRYEGIVTGVDLKVNSLELDIFPVVRSLVGDDLGTFLIVDMGAKVTNLLFVEKGVVKINRNINIGGNEITKNISSTLNVSWKRAEAFKKENDYLSDEGKRMVAPVLETIAKEANRIVESYFEEKGGRDKVDSVILTGGGSGINKIEKIFTEIMGMRVSLGDPWKKIAVKDKKIKDNSGDISRSLSVATGLALKGINEYKRKD